MAEPTSLPAGGGQVVYSYVVTNIGLPPLQKLTLVDDKCAPVVFVGGDTDGDNLLDPPEARSYTCTTFISLTTRNIATAEGFYNDPNFTTSADPRVLLALRKVTDQDDAIVVVAAPTPSPTGSVQIATSPPKVTLPPTDASPTGGQGNSSGTTMLLVILAGIAVAAPLLAVGRRRNQVR